MSSLLDSLLDCFWFFFSVQLYLSMTFRGHGKKNCRDNCFLIDQLCEFIDTAT